ncbi:MAG: phosphoglucosamine mutase [Bacteroidia bacterium]
MTLISSISGTRGTIGGRAGDNLTPIDIVKFAAAFGTWLNLRTGPTKVVIGRDARPSGQMVQDLVMQTLVSLGFEVIDLGMSTTPTVEMAIPHYHAKGGIMISASHNPIEWNALKLFNHRGEFVTKKDGLEILQILNEGLFNFASVQDLGKINVVNDYFYNHINAIQQLHLVDNYAIKKTGFKVVVDGVNSSGSIYVPLLLKALGVTDIIELNSVPNGYFAHDPEPLPKNLGQLAKRVIDEGADLGIAVDPDVDRLVFVDEKGNMFGEEYTLVAIADYVLQNNKSTVVSNLSSSRALDDIAEKYGCRRVVSAVGEVNVIEMMKRTDALIGGEGNGGVIYPELHYGRDALVGIALFLSFLAKSEKTASEIRASYPDYFMAKEKVSLTPTTDVDAILQSFKEKHAGADINDVDGVKVSFADRWVHLRKSNTEPIIRIYTEAPTQEEADALAKETMDSLS